jgi:hypothetical protein
MGVVLELLGRHETAMRLMLLLPVGLSAVVMLVGCPPEDYAGLLPPTQAQIAQIHDDPNMPPPEMRSRLAELGLDPVTINAIMQDKPLGNQFGGTLRTAYDKLVSGNFTALTPDEIQLYAIAAGQVDPAVSVQINDAQAQALVTMFQDSDLQTPTQVAAWLDTPGNFVPAVLPDGATVVRNLFVDFDFRSLLPVLP